MTRIALLVLLFLPTVLNTDTSLFNTDNQEGCGNGLEYVCIFKEECKGDADPNMVLTSQRATNYKPDVCDIHVQIKQYNASSYKIRSITSKNKFKVVKDQTSFICEKTADGKLSLTTDAEHIKLQLIPTKKTGGMWCEFYVTNTNDEEVFPTEKDMSIEYVNKKGEEQELKLAQSALIAMKAQFTGLKYKCDPRSIHRDSSKLDGQVYSLLPIVPNEHGGDCKSHKGYTMAFLNSEGAIEEADSIHCEEVESKWKYTVKPKGKGENTPAPADFQAACRLKTCMLCKNADKVTCAGTDCTPPKFHADPDCNRLRCDKFVEVDGGKRTKTGKFECRPTEDNKPGEWIFKENDDEEEGKPFTNATCYAEMDCASHSPLNCVVEKSEKSDCPKTDSPKGLKCPEGFKLELSSPDGIIKTSNVTCDKETGIYDYEDENGGRSPVKSDYEVACARVDKVVASGGFQLWYLIVIIVVALIIIALIVLCLFCMRRSKKADEQKRALLKKNDSAPSSTDSTKPQTGQTGQVHMQPCSTARQISSEQISEATAVEKTKKELVEKTVIEPTIDLKTAYSTDKDRSRQSKRETSSIVADYIDDAKHSQEEQKNIPDMDDNAPSSKASHVSKKEVKEVKERKDESNLKPRKFDLNEKEKQIAKGKWKKNEDYPTMADIESDWDDAKDGKHTSKQRTGTKEMATKDIPTADTPSQRAAKGTELCEKTAEMERLLDTPALKLQRASSDERPAASRGSDSQVSVRKTSNRITTLMSSLDVTQDQQK